MMKKEDALSRKIISAAIEVHRNIGPGLLESAYEQCFCKELTELNIDFERQVRLPVSYKGVKLGCEYRLDVVVDKLVIVEIKAVNRLESIHDAQLLTYLKLSRMRLGILLNFNAVLMKNGIKRLVNDL
ncbi:MAG: GxxExxY protein [Halobacteria archaeon]|nr:GxxExxY protein [Halobacteria archaeon]